MKKTKIWLMLDSRGFGGIESHVEQLALGLSSVRTEVTVIFISNYGSHPVQRRLLYAGLNCESLDGRFGTLWRAIKNGRPDVIHTHGYKAGILVRPLCRLLSITCVSTFHSGEDKEGLIKLYDWFDRRTAFLAHKVFAVSSPILSTLPCKAELADNFVNMREISLSKGDQIAFVGRLSKEKGTERFVSLAKRFPQLDFHVYGDGPLRKPLEKIAPPNVTFHGAQADMHKIWPRVGLLIIPSRAEGLPMASLEAMARGIPVAAFNVGALDQLIQHDKNGWLLPQNDVSGMVDVIHRWRNSDSQHRARIRANAVRTIRQRYSAEAVVPKLLKAYSQ